MWDVCMWDDKPTILLEMLGASMKTQIFEGLKISERQLQIIARDVISTLIILHSLGAVHGDVKPENIVGDNKNDSYRVKLVDFGSFLFLDDQDKIKIQSLPYRAPEVHVGGVFDASADIWALGVALSHIATGELLFDHRSIHKNLAKALCISNSRAPTPSGDPAFDNYYRDGLIVNEENEQDFYVYMPKHEFSFEKHYERYQLSRNFANFIKNCLMMDPRYRISARDALQDPFLKPV